MRAIAIPGRWIWGLTGLVAAVVLAVPGTRLITADGGPWSVHVPPMPDTVVRTVTVPQPVTSLDLQSYGAPARVESGPVSRVHVTETISYNKQNGGPPAVVHSVSGGRLTLADPACNTPDCAVSFAVTVPSGVNVTMATDGGSAVVSGAAGAQVDSGGGPVTAIGIDGPFTATAGGGSVTVSGAAGAQVDSGGGPVTATGIHGPFTATTDGGSLQLDRLAGPLRADTGGGPLFGQDVAAATATASTAGGSAQLTFAAAPDTVLVNTGGGPATLTLPGGPYELSADSAGGPESVGIATDPAAHRSITVSSGGGALEVGPAAGRLPGRPAKVRLGRLAAVLLNLDDRLVPRMDIGLSAAELGHAVSASIVSNACIRRPTMTTLTIRGLDEETHARLRVRAAQHGRSMEAEVRAILAERLASPAPEYGLGSHIHARFAALGGESLDLPARSETPRAAVFDA